MTTAIVNTGASPDHLKGATDKVNTHFAGTAYAQHDAGVGSHTHLSAGAEGGILATLSISGAGPHAIGGATDATIQLKVLGAFSGASPTGIKLTTALTTTAGSTSAYGATFAPSITTAAAADVYTVIATLRLEEPNITLGAGSSATATATLYVLNAATEGTNNYAIWVDAGNVLFDANLRAESVGIGVAASGTAGRLTVNENLIVSGAGPHTVNLGGVAGNDFAVDVTAFVVEGDTGKIGIGTSAPAYFLDLLVNTTSGTDGAYPAIRVGNPGTATHSIAKIVIEAGNAAVKTLLISGIDGSVFVTGAPAVNSGYVGTQTNNTFGVVTNNALRMYFNTSGLVGINRTTLGAQLDILASAAGTIGLIVDSQSSPTASAVQFRQNGTTRIHFMTSGDQTIGLETTAFDNGANRGTTIILARNSNGSTPAAGFITFYENDGAAARVWADASDNMRVLTTGDPTNANDTAGTVIGTQTSWHVLKDVLGPTRLSPVEALNTVLATRIYDFQFKEPSYKAPDGSNPVFTGLVGYDRAEWFLKNVAPGQVPVLNDINLFGYTILSIQALYARIDALERRLN